MEFEFEENGVYYYSKFPNWVKMKFFLDIKGICSFCKKKMDYQDMEVHRIKRKTSGGLYTLCPINHPDQNCMFVHKRCHQLLHQNELGNGSHSY